MSASKFIEVTQATKEALTRMQTNSAMKEKEILEAAVLWFEIKRNETAVKRAEAIARSDS